MVEHVANPAVMLVIALHRCVLRSEDVDFRICKKFVGVTKIQRSPEAGSQICITPAGVCVGVIFDRAEPVANPAISAVPRKRK